MVDKKSGNISKEDSVKFVRDLLDKGDKFFILAVGEEASVVAVHNMDGNITLNALRVMLEHSKRLKQAVTEIVMPDMEDLEDFGSAK